MCLKSRFVHPFCLSSRLDPGSSGPHDSVHTLLLLLPHCLFVSAVQAGQGRTLLLHRHLPDLGEWVWLHHTLTGSRPEQLRVEFCEIIIIGFGASSPHLASPLVSFPRCVRDVRGHHLHRDESGRWRRATVWLRIRASLGGFPSLPHQRPHLYRPEEERMREGAEGKRGGVVRIPLRTTSHSAYCPQTIDWHPNNTTKLHVPLIILNTKWRNVFLLGVFSLKQNSVSIMLPSHAENDHSCLLEQRCHHKLPVVTSKCV